MTKFWILTLSLLITISFNSCSSMGDDCGGGAGSCSDENVKTLLFNDTNYIPSLIKQQNVFVSNTGTTILVYTDGISGSLANITVGSKIEQVTCGTAHCNYFINCPTQKLKYSDTLNQEIFSVSRSFQINTWGTNNYGKYSFTSKEYSCLSILGSNFYFPSKDFNVGDFNSIDTLPSLTLGNIVYKNVYRFSIDSNKVNQSMPYECYYSKDNSGLLAFTLKGGVQYLRND